MEAVALGGGAVLGLLTALALLAREWIRARRERRLEDEPTEPDQVPPERPRRRRLWRD